MDIVIVRSLFKNLEFRKTFQNIFEINSNIDEKMKISRILVLNYRLENIQIKFLRFSSFKCNFRLNPDNHSIRLRNFEITRLKNCRTIGDVLFIYKLFNGIFVAEGISQDISLKFLLDVKDNKKYFVYHSEI